jgi:hypothetical protein
MMTRGAQIKQNFTKANIAFIIKERCIFENYFYHFVHEMQREIMSTNCQYVVFKHLSYQGMLHMALHCLRQN